MVKFNTGYTSLLQVHHHFLEAYCIFVESMDDPVFKRSLLTKNILHVVLTYSGRGETTFRSVWDIKSTFRMWLTMPFTINEILQFSLQINLVQHHAFCLFCLISRSIVVPLFLLLEQPESWLVVTKGSLLQSFQPHKIFMRVTCKYSKHQPSWAWPKLGHAQLATSTHWLRLP